MENKKIKCSRCNVGLALTKTVLKYMGRSFTHEIPRCPKCGKAYVSRELAEGRMAEVEAQLEDK